MISFKTLFPYKINRKDMFERRKLTVGLDIRILLKYIYSDLGFLPDTFQKRASTIFGPRSDCGIFVL